MSVHRLSAGVAAAAWLAMASPAGAAVEIQWWHAMGGELGQKLEKIANDFNASQADYKVVPVFKGSYPEAMTAAIAAFRARQNPALLRTLTDVAQTVRLVDGDEKTITLHAVSINSGR